jgi:hypothetical protein
MAQLLSINAVPKKGLRQSACFLFAEWRYTAAAVALMRARMAGV